MLLRPAYEVRREGSVFSLSAHWGYGPVSGLASGPVPRGTPFPGRTDYAAGGCLNVFLAFVCCSCGVHSG